MNWQIKPIRTHAEVAAIMGISRQNVQNGERDAIRKLRKLLKSTWEDYSDGVANDHCSGTSPCVITERKGKRLKLS